MSLKERILRTQAARNKKQELFRKQNAGQQQRDGAALFLLRVRSHNKWSQQDLADEIGRFGVQCSQGVVARWENGSRPVSPESFLPLAQALDCVQREYCADFVRLFGLSNQLRQLELRLRVLGLNSNNPTVQHEALRKWIMATANRLSKNLTGKAINR